MEKYRSHKEVWADKILRVEPDPKGGGGFCLNMESSPKQFVTENFYARGGPYEDDLGYLVKYEDGYMSWTPTKAFEEGYAKISAIGVGYLQGVNKTLHNSDVSGARQNVKDIKVVGNGDMFQLLCKASSENEGWMKSTKAMGLPNGALVQVTTQQRNPDGSYAVAEALSFVPGVQIVEDDEGGRKLIDLNCGVAGGATLMQATTVAEGGLSMNRNAI